MGKCDGLANRRGAGRYGLSLMIECRNHKDT
jgi:hypothetical protein